MKSKCKAAIFIISILMLLPASKIDAQSASKWTIGGRGGLSLLDGTAGLQLGPTAELKINNNFSLEGEFNINTQGGTPVEINTNARYYFSSGFSKLNTYGEAGLGLWIYSGGPYLGVKFGGGALFNIDPRLTVPVDLQVGPVFSSGSTVFYFAITSGIRYALN